MGACISLVGSVEANHRHPVQSSDDHVRKGLDQYVEPGCDELNDSGPVAVGISGDKMECGGEACNSDSADHPDRMQSTGSGDLVRKGLDQYMELGCNKLAVGISDRIESGGGEAEENIFDYAYSYEEGPFEYDPSMSLRPPTPPLPPPAPATFHKITDVNLNFRESDEVTLVPLHNFVDTDEFSLCSSLQDDARSVCSDSCLFEEAHWAALGFPSSTNPSTVADHLVKETITVLDGTAAEIPGSRIQIISKLSSAVPGAIVRRARVTRSAARSSSPVRDPCALQIATYGSINQINTARANLQDSLFTVMPHATLVARSKTSGSIVPIETSKLVTGYFLGKDSGECFASDTTPDAVADTLASGVNLDVTAALSAAKMRRKDL